MIEPNNSGAPGAQTGDQFWQLALAVNAAFKGLLGANGQSGHVCASTFPVHCHINVELGWESVQRQVAAALPRQLADGDVVVIADKVVAAALGRIGPRRVIRDHDPKTVHPNQLPELAKQWSAELGFPIDQYHLLLADEYGLDHASLGTDLPNQRSSELSAVIKSMCGFEVDVVISDTDTGLDIRRPLIGTVTIAATPLGATAGINLYEAMRCAVAAEFTRGHNLGVPIVLCIPAERRRKRADIGQSRQYLGILDAAREPGIAHA